MRALIGTCVIIDALQNREDFSRDAQTIFIMAANDRFTGLITAKSVTDINYLMHRYTHDDRASREVLNKLFSLFDVADTTGMDCRRAIPSHTSDYEDAVMMETALRTEVDCIITRNTHDYRTSPVPVFTPRDFIKQTELTDL